MESTTPLPYVAGKDKDPYKETKYYFPRDLIGYGESSLDPKWPNNAKIAVSFVINYEEGAERSLLNGDETCENRLWTAAGSPLFADRALNIESEYEYGSRVGVWRLLRLFKKHNFPVTAYAVGQAFEKNPDVAKAFVRDGHEIASHAYRWIDYHNFPPEKEKAFIKQQLESIKASTGDYPSGWYYGRLSPRSHALVAETYKEMGIPLLYMSDFYGDDVPVWKDLASEKDLPESEKKGLLLVPYSYDCNDYRFFTANGFRSGRAFNEHLTDAFDILYDESAKMMTIGLHCRVIGKPGYFAALKKFVEHVAKHPDAWVTTRKEIALHFRQQYPYVPKN